MTTLSRDRSAWLCLVETLVLLALGLGACRRHQQIDSGPAVQRGPAPAYAAVAAAYNARLIHLDRLSGSCSLNIRARGLEDDRIKEQVQGNLQIMLPSSIALRIDKFGQVLFYLGSNIERYWWFDLTHDAKVAMVGEHDRATLETVTSFGIPVHPLDLIEVLGIKSLPAQAGAGARVAWSPNGRLLGVTLAGRWGLRQYWLDPASYDPMQIELQTPAGEALVKCRLERFHTIEVVGDANARPRVAEQFFVELPRQEAQVTITLQDVKNPGPAQRVKVFDLPTLLTYYNIEDVRSVDGAAQGASPPADGKSPAPASPAKDGRR